MFSVDDRDRARDHVLGMAEADPRVVAAAVVGGLADGPGDRWSDLDLTFGVDDAASVDDVLEEWTQEVAAELGGVHLFDLPAGAAIYRVFLLPGCLQVDLSFAPASASARAGRGSGCSSAARRSSRSRRRPRRTSSSGSASTTFCARVSRSSAAAGGRRSTGSAASASRRFSSPAAGVGSKGGRRFDDLPAEALEAFESSLVRSLEPEELDRALRSAISVLQRESEDAAELASAVEAQLQALASPT